MQICDILFAVVVMVTLSFYYRFVKLSLALLAAVALLKTWAHLPFWNDRKISDNSVTSTNFTFDILVCLISLPLFCFFFLFLTLVPFGTTCFLIWKMVKKPHCYAAVVIFLTISLQACADNLQCKRVQSVYGTMLRGHVFQESNAANILACSLLCNSDIRCQSINYVISRHLCELNNRTKEARPEDYVQDVDRVYLTRPSERGIELEISAISELPRESFKCGHLICFFTCIFFAFCILFYNSYTCPMKLKKEHYARMGQVILRCPLRPQKFI